MLLDNARKFYSRITVAVPVAREVGELGYATHGWRLAKAAERVA